VEHVVEDGYFCPRREQPPRIEGHPSSEGAVHDRGRLAEYLRTKEVEPYLRAADRYREILDAMLRCSPGRSAWNSARTRLARRGTIQ
jgi:hypothetical protein